MQIGSGLGRFNINNISIDPKIVSKTNAITIRLLIQDFVSAYIFKMVSLSGRMNAGY